MFYEDNSYGLHHVEAASSDGVHFTKVGILTANGLDPNSLGWGDMAYNRDDGYWYAAFNTDPRTPSSTGGFVERGAYGIGLYRISEASLLTGATPWATARHCRYQPQRVRRELYPGIRARHVRQSRFGAVHTNVHFHIESAGGVE